MKRVIVCVALAGLVAAVGYGLYCAWWNDNYFVTEYDEHHAPPHDDLQLVDDKIADKRPVFDDKCVDSRALGDWELNASAAVIRLDCPMIIPNRDREMLVLRPSYADAITAAKACGLNLLPSANTLDGAAKQFDDGLYAALDLACFRGEIGLAPAAPVWAAAVLQRLPKQSTARPFLAAALELAGKTFDLAAAEKQESDRWLAQFERNQAASKPISFYTWTPELKQVWRFFRFLQHEFTEDDLAIPRDVAAVLQQNDDLRKQHLAINDFYGRLTNPSICLPVDALIDDKQALPQLAKEHLARRAAAAVFPPSTSRETELFDRMFPTGLPAGVNLMGVLIQRIRSGEVDLKPGENDGWYQHQVYALETLLLPAKGQENDKLLLTAEYKKRLVEAFKALATKRRETHARQLAKTKSSAAAPPQPKVQVSPRLRVEPCATFYLRNARAYAFLQDFLTAAVGRERLEKLHGLRQGGERPPTLHAELGAVRSRFYGFYLLSCEDIGMKPQLADGELADLPAAKQAAKDWLGNLVNNVDLLCDARVSVQIFVDPLHKTRIWATLGVRLAHLDASYAQPPRMRPKDGAGPWTEVESNQLGNSRYVIPVDEFAEIELAGSSALTREELREACDRHKTKEEIVRGLCGK